jgi:histidinol-phosphate/aromatic aminotransferase/cobyric acid decarboxylase-like protein
MNGFVRAHGGPDRCELESLGLAPEELLDFSVSTNPYGPAPAMIEAIRSAPLAPYPDPRATLARRRLGRHLGVPSERIALGNGAADLLWGLARALLGPGRTLLTVEPTFCELRAAASAAGAAVVEWRARPEDGFAIDLDAVARRALACRADVVYLCTPNVPTGATVPASAVAAWARSLAGVTVVLDQSFLLLSERFADHDVALPDNVACVRSLTKEHGIPGIRVGYVLACEALLARLEQQRPAWSTSAPAQAAVIAACSEGAFVADSRARLLAHRIGLACLLTGLGFAPVASTANFFLVPVGDAAKLRRRLLDRHRLLVRDCASFGLPAYVRLAARPAAQSDLLAQAMAMEVQR